MSVNAEEQAQVKKVLDEVAAAQQAANQPPPVPTEMRRANITGVLKTEKDASLSATVNQEIQVEVPKNATDQHMSQTVLTILAMIYRLGGLTTKVDSEHYKFYPIDQFKRLDVEFAKVSGIHLV